MKLTSKLLLPLFLTIFFYSCKDQAPTVESLMAEIDADASLNTLTKAEKKADWVLLFDGKTFDGWHGFNMNGAPDCWLVEDGALKILTEGGAETSLGLLTDKKYKSFALSLEFQLTEAANSGIIYQVAEDAKYSYPYETGTEYQVIDDANWPDPLEDWQISGANYAMYPPISKPFKEVGDWNQVMLVIDGNQITHVLNGEVVVEYEKYSDDWMKLRNSGKWSDYPDYGKFDEGYITLQNHGTKVNYRNIKIKEL